MRFECVCHRIGDDGFKLAHFGFIICQGGFEASFGIDVSVSPYVSCFYLRASEISSMHAKLYKEGFVCWEMVVCMEMIWYPLMIYLWFSYIRAVYILFSICKFLRGKFSVLIWHDCTDSIFSFVQIEFYIDNLEVSRLLVSFLDLFTIEVLFMIFGSSSMKPKNFKGRRYGRFIKCSPLILNQMYLNMDQRVNISIYSLVWRYWEVQVVVVVNVIAFLMVSIYVSHWWL